MAGAAAIASLLGQQWRELGLYEGAEVTIVSHGDPVVLCVFSNRFAVCRRCARHVTVEVLRRMAA
ncbi:MAG: ferrous iron transport protein A [Armatimonadetes bacterium]|nr:ferrous iron transport protein A [Armatimonadota bacterium]